MKFFQSKQRQVETLLANYRAEAIRCVLLAQEALEDFCKNSDGEALEAAVKRVHQAESQADDIRREVEDLMYVRALFPESREDVLSLLEIMDKLPNRAESSLQDLSIQGLTIPESLSEDILLLTEICVRAAKALFRASEQLFGDFTSAVVTVGKVDELESEADIIEQKLIRKIFQGSFSDLDKLLLRELVRNIASISDRAENAGDRIRILVVKRMG